MSKFIMTTEWPGGGSYSKFTKEELTKVLEEMGVPYQTINRLFSMVKSGRYNEWVVLGWEGKNYKFAKEDFGPPISDSWGDVDDKEPESNHYGYDEDNSWWDFDN